MAALWLEFVKINMIILPKKINQHVYNKNTFFIIKLEKRSIEFNIKHTHDKL